MSDPLVSIVMPSFNQGVFIGESVRSVLAQSYANLELIVMDGGSTDDTHAVLRSVQSQDPRLRWFTQPDTGPAQAINRALDKARGTIIGWLNSDDLYPPGAVQRAVSALAANPTWLMVYGQGQHVDGDGAFLSDYPTRPAGTPASQFAAGCFICQPTVFFKRTMRVMLGPLDETLRTAFDYDYWLKAFNAFHERIGFVDEVQAFSRLHDLCITMRQRRTVSLESMSLIARHLGHAPAHWLLSHVDEALATAEPSMTAQEAKGYISSLVQSASAFVPANELAPLEQKLRVRAGLPAQELPPATGLQCPYSGVEVRALILLLREDLREWLEYWRPDQAHAYRAWLVCNGVKEYPGLAHDPAFRADVLAPSPQHPSLRQLDVVLWQARPDVQKAFPLPAATTELRAWVESHGCAEYGLGALLQAPATVPAITPWRERPFGVNLFGHVFSQFGVGEDVRMAALALQAAGVPFALLDVPPGPGIAQGDRSLEHLVGTEAPYAFNLFCMAAPEHARFRAMHGSALTEGRYNIGYWPWELAKWPAPWAPLFGLVDEVWASSQHTLGAVLGAAPPNVPCRLMPMAVELGEVSDFGGKAAARQHFGLPSEKSYLFCFSFDLNSSIHRKNPQACVDAFLAAFPAQGEDCGEPADVGLVIKVHPPRQPHAAWDALKALAAQDRRIYIIEATLSRPDLLALYACCDCFVSLHRAEGFGRGIAEALLLGLQVVATGYSGNVDFCKSPGAMLAPYKLRAVCFNEYMHSENQVWAEVGIEIVAILQNFILERKNRAPSSTIQSKTAPNNIGEIYLHHLRKLHPL